MAARLRHRKGIADLAEAISLDYTARSAVPGRAVLLLKSGFYKDLHDKKHTLHLIAFRAPTFLTGSRAKKLRKRPLSGSVLVRQCKYKNLVGVAGVQFRRERVQTGTDQRVAGAYRNVLVPV